MTTNTKTRNYSNGKIYKIECLNGDADDIYVGSTTKEFLSQRMTKHRGGYKRWLNKQLDYMSSFKLFEKYGVDNCIITLIESVNANTLDELKAREAHYIRTLNCVNRNIPLRTIQEYHVKYYEDNKDKIKEYKNQYYENNKDKRKEADKNYYENNKEKIRKYREEYQILNKEKLNEISRQYYEKNKTSENEKRRQRYENNKDNIKEERKVKINCPTCNCLIVKCSLSCHNKTKKHINAQSKLDAVQIV